MCLGIKFDIRVISHPLKLPLPRVNGQAELVNVLLHAQEVDLNINRGVGQRVIGCSQIPEHEIVSFGWCLCPGLTDERHQEDQRHDGGLVG